MKVSIPLSTVALVLALNISCSKGSSSSTPVLVEDSENGGLVSSDKPRNITLPNDSDSDSSTTKPGASTNPVITYSSDITAANELNWQLVGECFINDFTVEIFANGNKLGDSICERGVFSNYSLDMSSLADGELSITAMQTNGGRQSISEPVLVSKDSQSAIVTITEPSPVTALNQNEYSLSGSCSLNDQSIQLSINSSVLVETNCAFGSWSSGPLDLSSLADGMLLVNVLHASVASAELSTSKDTSSLQIQIGQLDDIMESNQGSYLVSGSCSLNGAAITLTIGNISGNSTCQSGGFLSSQLDLSSLPEGDVEISATLSGADNAVASSAVTVAKVTSKPYVASLSVAQRMSNSIVLSLVAEDPNGDGIAAVELGYRIEGSSSWNKIYSDYTGAKELEVSGLYPGLRYQFRARVLYSPAAKASLWSAVITGETQPESGLFDSPNKSMNVGGAVDCSVVALEDGTEVTLNGEVLASLSRGQTHRFTSAQFDVLDANKPIYAAGRAGSGGANYKGNMTFMPTAWAGKSFSLTAYRNSSQNLSIYAVENSIVTLYSGSEVIESIQLAAGEGGVIRWTPLGAFQLKSTGAVLAFHYAEGSGSYVIDPKPLLPSAKEIIGFPSRYMKLSADSDATAYTAIHSGSQSEIGTLSRQGHHEIHATGATQTLYRANSLLVSANKPLAAASFADLNGWSAAPFLPTYLMKRNFATNVPSDYVAFAAKSSGVIRVYTSSQSLSDEPYATLNLSRSGENENAPYSAYLSGNLPAGLTIVSEVDVAAWYQPNSDIGGADEDETILYGN